MNYLWHHHDMLYSSTTPTNIHLNHHTPVADENALQADLSNF